MIYFIEHSGRIKVGFATNVDRRLSEFKTAIPSFVRLGSMEGTRGHERAIHEALSAFRLEGEWFHDCSYVREFLLAVMKHGIEESLPKAEPPHSPTMWDERARRLVTIICKGRSESELASIENELSIPPRTLWTIRYRQRREVSVGEYFALLAAARETNKRRLAEIARDEAFVADLEREDADTTNSIFDVERELYGAQAAAKALLGESH